jgi:hypothetical protein
MKLVPENIDESQSFERGIDPKEAIGLGHGDKLKAKKLYEKIIDIINDLDYPEYLDGDIEGNPMDIQKIGDILGIIYDRSIKGDFFDEWLSDVYNEISRWESNGEDPTDVLKDVKDVAEDILYEINTELGIENGI